MSYKYTIETLKKADIFVLEARDKNEAFSQGRLICRQQNKKFIRVMPVKLKLKNTI